MKMVRPEMDSLTKLIQTIKILLKSMDLHSSQKSLLEVKGSHLVRIAYNLKMDKMFIDHLLKAQNSAKEFMDALL